MLEDEAGNNEQAENLYIETAQLALEMVCTGMCVQ